MRLPFSRIAVAALARRPVRLVAVALLIATLGMGSRALPTSADLPYITVSAPVAVMPASGVSVSVPLQFVQQTTYPITVTNPTTVTGVTSVIGPTVSASSPSAAGTATDIAPDNCWNYDSWCAYCTFHSSPECASYPPGKRPASTGAASSTPGVGSPSAAPSGGAPASGGGGGPAYP